MLSGYEKICSAAYWLALIIWFSVISAAAITAISAFASLPEMDLTLGAYPQADGVDHGRLAAGYVTQPIFVFADLVQAACIVIVLITLVLQVTVFGMRLRRPANWIRLICVLGAALLFAVRAAAVTPEMNADLHAYREHLQAGQIDTARPRYNEFEAGHRTSRHLYDGTFALVLVGIIASSAAFVHDPRRDSTKKSPEPLLEPPQLSGKP